jgi:hypothetical protein
MQGLELWLAGTWQTAFLDSLRAELQVMWPQQTTAFLQASDEKGCKWLSSSELATLKSVKP